MRAVVMAGGQGTRLRPLTSNQPKPMLPIVGRPMMEHILRLARRHGITEVVATVQFLASVIRNYFGDGSDLGMSLSYATETDPLGTAGSVRNAAPLLGDRFLVLSGDSLTDLDLTDLIRFHEEKGAAVTVTLQRVEDPLEFGIVIADDEGRVQRFLEKPGWGDVFSDTINTGIYVIEREVLEFVPGDREFDFSKDLFPALLDRGLPMFGYVTDRYWTDVGTLESYQAAHRAVLDREVEVEIDGFEIRPGIWLGEGAELDPDAHVQGPAYIGENTRVESGVDLREYSVLGRGVAVKSGAFLQRAIVHDYVYVGPSVSLRGCVVGRNSDVKFGARLEEGVVLADDCHVGEGAVLNPRVKVYPFKSVDPGAIVLNSIIWQSGGARGLFGDRGVRGLINVDITPEMVVRLALAYGSLLPSRSTLVACRDATRAARIFKRAMCAGLNSAGQDCHDLELVPIPVARFYARSARAVGGFSVRTAPGDPATVEIQFFDEDGVDISASMQRQLERAYYRDDLRRAFHHDIGQLNFPARGRDYYEQGLMDAVDVQAIRGMAPKLVIDYGWGSTCLTGPRIFGRLAGDVLAVNGTLDEDRVVLSDTEGPEDFKELGRLVQSSGSDLGVILDSTGERVRLVAGTGEVLDGRTALLAYVWLVARTSREPTVALPVTASRIASHILGEAGGRVVWTRLSSSALMGAARGGAVLAGDEGGGYIFPEFLASYDAVLSAMKFLELLARAGVTTAQILEYLPQPHIASHAVATPWEARGTVMRRLLERLDGANVDTTDGVKAYRGEDWALVVPHPQEPVIRIWAEAGTMEEANSLAEEFGSLVEELKG